MRCSGRLGGGWRRGLGRIMSGCSGGGDGREGAFAEIVGGGECGEEVGAGDFGGMVWEGWGCGREVAGALGGGEV